jgi:hypothetical protein
MLWHFYNRDHHAAVHGRRLDRELVLTVPANHRPPCGSADGRTKHDVAQEVLVVDES